MTPDELREAARRLAEKAPELDDAAMRRLAALFVLAHPERPRAKAAG